MPLDVGSEPTLRLAYMTCINLFFGKVTHWNNCLYFRPIALILDAIPKNYHVQQSWTHYTPSCYCLNGGNPSLDYWSYNIISQMAISPMSWSCVWLKKGKMFFRYYFSWAQKKRNEKIISKHFSEKKIKGKTPQLSFFCCQTDIVSAHWSIVIHRVNII